MSSLTFTFAAIGNHGLTIDKASFDGSNDPDGTMNPAEHVEYWLSEMSSQMRELLTAAGLLIDTTAKSITIEIGAITRAYGLCQAVDDAYEQLDDQRFETLYRMNRREWWSTYMGFGGDDSVDYNSSYLTIVLDVLVELERMHYSH